MIHTNLSFTIRQIYNLLKDNVQAITKGFDSLKGISH